jgi:phage FluMu gp28-like protein
MNALPVGAPSRWLAWLVEYLDLADATGDPDAQWEPYQVHFLNNSDLFAIWNKSRQVGWSWTAAADAVSHGSQIPRTTNIFTSINLEEASEKIRYAKQIVEALDVEVRPKLVIDNRLEIEFENGSRLISHPCRPVRGKARGRVYLDEFAHYPKDVEIYTSALPVVTRGGQLLIGSTPLGAKGRFWEIFDQKIQPYPGYRRRAVPWWCVAALCKDVPNAQKLAYAMLTHERVAVFGTERLKQIFANLPLEDFQQEYEAAWVDEASAWITWDEIKRNQLDAQAGRLLCWKAESVDDALATIEPLQRAIRDAHIEQVLVGGMDIGRTRNATEIVLLGKSTAGALPYRLGVTLAGVEFDKQRAVAQALLDHLPIAQLLIDQNGIGRDLAEKLNAVHGTRAQGVDFTNATKELWAVETKLQFQRAHAPIPLDRDLSYQIHSIKKMTTAAKNSVFDAPRSDKHHADKFWALALGIWAGREADSGTGEWGSVETETY